MVIHPFSPPILPSDYPHIYSSPPPSTSSDASSSPRKRKCEFDTEPEYNDHIVKKQQDEFITPLTPTSSPSTLSILQRLTPPSDPEGPYVYNHSQSHKTNEINSFTNASYVTSSQRVEIKSHSSDAFTSIPAQNRFLRDLHLSARAHQSARKHEDEEMWEEEEEIVADRYSEMNKVLGSRKQHW